MLLVQKRSVPSRLSTENVEDCLLQVMIKITLKNAQQNILLLKDAQTVAIGRYRAVLVTLI